MPIYFRKCFYNEFLVITRNGIYALWSKMFKNMKYSTLEYIIKVYTTTKV